METLEKRVLLSGGPDASNLPIAHSLGDIAVPAGVQVGDLNDDGLVNNLDISPYVEALRIGGDVADPDNLAAFEVAVPGGSFAAADLNRDGSADNLDISLFVDLLLGLVGLEGQLANDTAFEGTTNFDGVTSDPTVAGRVRIPSLLITLRAGLEPAPNANFVDVTQQVQPDVRFTLGPPVLEQINGGPLAEGAQTLHLGATFDAGEMITLDVSFELDTIPPLGPFFDLDAATDSGAFGDQQTALDPVNLVGVTDAGAQVELRGFDRTTLADETGLFVFEDVPAVDGPNEFIIRASDRAGNSSESSQTVTKVDADGPEIEVGLETDSGSSSSDAITSEPTIAGSLLDSNAITRFLTAFDDTQESSFVDVAAQLVDGAFRFDDAGLTPINLGVPLADGAHVLHLVVTDSLDNQSTASFPFTLDRSAPLLRLDGPPEGATLSGLELIQGVSTDAGASQPATYQLDAGAPIDLTVVAGAFAQPIAFEGVENGAHTLTVRATDVAGNASTEQVDITIDIRPFGFSINETNPGGGEIDVGVTVRPTIFFNEPVDTATLSTANTFATLGPSEPLDAAVVPSPDGMFAILFPAEPWPSGTVVQIHLDGDSIRSRDGAQALDADGDGEPGGQLAFTFTTVSLASLPGTSLSGVVVDDGPDRRIFTADDVDADAEGRFTIPAVPGGNIKVVIDGRTASNMPAGFYFPEMVMNVDMVVGQENKLFPNTAFFHLPRLSTQILQEIDFTGPDPQPVLLVADEFSGPDLTPQQRQQYTLEIQPGSLVSEGGQRLDRARIGFSTVDPEIVRTMLPEGVLQSEIRFPITVQAFDENGFTGALIPRFTIPAPMRQPNFFNHPAGTKLDFLQFDHDTGLLVFEGSMTVEPDAQTVVTDPGTGITRPGWYPQPPQGTRTCETRTVVDGENPPGSQISVSASPAGDVRDLLFFKDDEQFTITVANNAPSSDQQNNEVECAINNEQDIPLHVEIKVEGYDFGRQFINDLRASYEFSVLHGKDVPTTFKLKPLIPLLRAEHISKDRMYGVKFRIKTSNARSGEPIDEKMMHVYRYLHAEDLEHEDER